MRAKAIYIFLKMRLKIAILIHYHKRKRKIRACFKRQEISLLPDGRWRKQYFEPVINLLFPDTSKLKILTVSFKNCSLIMASRALEGVLISLICISQWSESIRMELAFLRSNCITIPVAFCKRKEDFIWKAFRNKDDSQRGWNVSPVGAAFHQLLIGPP